MPGLRGGNLMPTTVTGLSGRVRLRVLLLVIAVEDEGRPSFWCMSWRRTAGGVDLTLRDLLATVVVFDGAD